MPKSTTNPKLDHWIRKLREHEMPVFAQTARVIAGKAHDDNAPAAELSKLILQDASMTTRLLRMANSAYYNPGGEHINTISRAIVVLGLNAVHKLCLCIAVLDSFSGSGHQRMATEMARAFHSALQAKGLAEKCGEKHTEEIFIATLLHSLGELAVWCFAENIDPRGVAQLETMLENHELRPSDAERQTIGFRIRELTAHLNDEWHLSPLLADVLNPRHRDNRRTHLVQLGHELAHALEQGWEAPSVQQVLQTISKTTGLDEEDLAPNVADNARAAAETVAGLGATELAQLIPQQQALKDIMLPTPADTATAYPQPDTGLQLDVLRELSQMITGPKARADLFLQTTVEGIYRGVGVDRALYGLLTPDMKTLAAKYVLGTDSQSLTRDFKFTVTQPGPNVLGYAMGQTAVLWVGSEQAVQLKRMLTPAIEAVSGAEFFIAPLYIGAKTIGCLYADRRPSARGLDEDALAGFSLFAQQACLGLSHIKR